MHGGPAGSPGPWESQAQRAPRRRRHVAGGAQKLQKAKQGQVQGPAQPWSLLEATHGSASHFMGTLAQRLLWGHPAAQGPARGRPALWLVAAVGPRRPLPAVQCIVGSACCCGSPRGPGRASQTARAALRDSTRRSQGAAGEGREEDGLRPGTPAQACPS